jgi:hypothetical protein
MTEHEAAVGDALTDMISQAVQALMRKDEWAVWQALDDAGALRTLREWERVRGRDMPSEAEVEAEMEKLRAEAHNWRPPT